MDGSRIGFIGLGRSWLFYGVEFIFTLIRVNY